jgi:hypothetical protein
MPYASDRAASRYGRDRDLLPAGPRMGPYELRYDVRRGYDQPLHGTASGPDLSAEDVLHFRARDEGDRAG